MKNRPTVPAFFLEEQAKRIGDILQQRANIPREDLEYLVETVSKLKDERLKACVAGLIGWGDEERAELETFVAVALDVMSKTTVSRMRESARTVNIRFLMKGVE